METRAYLLHALSPLHAGTGQAVDVIDLPIARMAATGIPIVPGSSIKGVLRDAWQPDGDAPADGRERHFAVFGSSHDKVEAPEAHAGALAVGDARLLALPIRSFRGTFAWVTSPLLLQLAQRDLPDAREGFVVVPPNGNEKRWAMVGDQNSLNAHVAGGTDRVYLQDLDLPMTVSPAVDRWGKYLAGWAMPEAPTMFTRRFVVVDDESMTFLWETGTQVDTRVRLDPKTRTAAGSALWAEESLPPETLLLGLLIADRSRRREMPMSPAEVLDFALKARASLQFGGKATVGRGRCAMIPQLRGGSDRC